LVGRFPLKRQASVADHDLGGRAAIPPVSEPGVR
jgi:hypothetical protein